MHNPSMARGAGRQKGMALIVVLGFLAALSLIVIGVVSNSRSTVQAASRHLVRAQAQMAIEGAIDYAANVLVAARGTTPAIMMAPEVIEVSGWRIRISVRSERGKVDVNYADQLLLATLFRSAGASADAAQAMAAAVEDWRDGDDLLQLNGAEGRQYEAAGLPWRPSNRFFDSVGQLKLVLGMSPRIYDCIRTELTVLTQAPGVVVEQASPALQKALGVELPDASRPGEPAPVLSNQIISPGDVFEVTAELEDKGRNIRRGERVSIRVTGNPEDPFWVLGIEPLYPLRENALLACPSQRADGAK
jgi:general secretion pathway protein K